MSQNFSAEPLQVLPYGLLSLQDPTVDDDPHWQQEFYYESLQCATDITLLDVCDSSADAISVVTADTDSRLLHYQPFVVEAIDKCSTFGYKEHDVQQRALAALEAGTQKAVEYEFWTGAAAKANSLDDNRYLASMTSTDVTPSPGTPVKVKYGQALLEQALANCGLGTRGVLHVTHEVASALNPKVVGDHLESPLGNYIVAGSGYDGSGPDGTIPAVGQWIYATGWTTVRLSTSQALGTKLLQQVDPKDNTWEVRAERAAAVTFDGCCIFAVHVDLSLDYQ